MILEKLVLEKEKKIKYMILKCILSILELTLPLFYVFLAKYKHMLTNDKQNAAACSEGARQIKSFFYFMAFYCYSLTTGFLWYQIRSDPEIV